MEDSTYYVKAIIREIKSLLSDNKSSQDFIERLYFFIDETSNDLPKEIVMKLEELNDVAARFEPDIEVRKAEPIFVDEYVLKLKAKAVLIFLEDYLDKGKGSDHDKDNEK